MAKTGEQKFHDLINQAKVKLSSGKIEDAYSKIHDAYELAYGGNFTFAKCAISSEEKNELNFLRMKLKVMLAETPKFGRSHADLYAAARQSGDAILQSNQSAKKSTDKKDQEDKEERKNESHVPINPSKLLSAEGIDEEYRGELTLYYAIALNRTGKKELAKTHLNTVIAEVTDNDLVAQAKLELARIYVTEGKHRDAGNLLLGLTGDNIFTKQRQELDSKVRTEYRTQAERIVTAALGDALKEVVGAPSRLEPKTVLYPEKAKRLVTVLTNQLLAKNILDHNPSADELSELTKFIKEELTLIKVTVGKGNKTKDVNLFEAVLRKDPKAAYKHVHMNITEKEINEQNESLSKIIGSAEKNWVEYLGNSRNQIDFGNSRRHSVVQNTSINDHNPFQNSQQFSSVQQSAYPTPPSYNPQVQQNQLLYTQQIFSQGSQLQNSQFTNLAPQPTNQSFSSSSQPQNSATNWTVNTTNSRNSGSHGQNPFG